MIGLFGLVGCGQAFRRDALRFCRLARQDLVEARKVMLLTLRVRGMDETAAIIGRAAPRPYTVISECIDTGRVLP